MISDSLIFYISFPIKGEEWQVQCSLTALCDDPEAHIVIDDEQVEVVRVVSAKLEDVSLDEKAWRELLREHGLLSDFCEQLMTYLSFLTWTLSKPMAKA